MGQVSCALVAADAQAGADTSQQLGRLAVVIQPSQAALIGLRAPRCHSLEAATPELRLAFGLGRQRPPVVPSGGSGEWA